MISDLRSAWLAVGMAACAVDDGAAPRDQRPDDVVAGSNEFLISGTVFPSFVPTDLEDVIDLNNDHKADICGRSSTGVVCALGDGSVFGTLAIGAGQFSDAFGWSAERYYATIRFPDLNNDGKADVCGRAAGGIVCGLMSGSNFGTVTSWTSNFSDSSGFGLGAQYYGTIAFPDLNNDGKADICGRASDGVRCALNTGSGFGPLNFHAPQFSDANGWNLTEYSSTIRYPDVNGDHRADICGRAPDGVYCALNTGTTFSAATRWTTNFSDTLGWNVGPQYFATIRFPDLDHDGKADVCGRAGTGVVCGLSTGTGFGALTFSASQFSDTNNWGISARFYSTIRFADINGDLKPDVCGRGADGIHCALTGATNFAVDTNWNQGYADGAGWTLEPEYSTIRFPDLNNDGKADVCGRSVGGIRCALSSGVKFGNGTANAPWTSNFSNSAGWSTPPYYSTIRFP